MLQESRMSWSLSGRVLGIQTMERWISCSKSIFNYSTFAWAVICMCEFTNAGSMMLGEAWRTFTGEPSDGVNTQELTVVLFGWTLIQIWKKEKLYNIKYHLIRNANTALWHVGYRSFTVTRTVYDYCVYFYMGADLFSVKFQSFYSHWPTNELQMNEMPETQRGTVEGGTKVMLDKDKRPTKNWTPWAVLFRFTNKSNNKNAGWCTVSEPLALNQNKKYRTRIIRFCFTVCACHLCSSSHLPAWCIHEGRNKGSLPLCSYRWSYKALVPVCTHPHLETGDIVRMRQKKVR